MEAKLFWKSVIRRKGSLLLLMTLIAVSTFGFMLRAVEYLAVSQEIGRISREYRPIGSLSAPDLIVTEGVLPVMESPYVELADINRFCPVVLSDIYNADLDGALEDWEWEEWWGEWEDKWSISPSELMVWGTVTMASDTDQPNVRLYNFLIEEGVYGYPEFIQPGTQIRLELEIPEDGTDPMPVMERGKSYLVKGYPILEENIFWKEGEALKVRQLPLGEGLWFLEGEPDSETAEKYLGEDFELKERNRHAMVAVGTKDMTVMPLVQEASRDFYLEEGRWITKQDQDEGNRVCVVRKEFADVRGLSVGDSLTMTFQDRIDFHAGYALPQEDTWESGKKTKETLEIVGIYGRMYGGLVNSPGWSYVAVEGNYLYVPDSCIPEHYAEMDEIEEGRFSFVLSDPREKDLFLVEMEEKLASLGISITFVENNWDNFYQSARSVEQGGFYSLIIFGALLVLALAAVVFLYTWQRRKECAVARALGIPAKRAAACACLPLMVLGILGILAGGLLAWKLGLSKAGETLAALESGGTADLSGSWFLGILLLVWLLLSLALLAGSLSQAGKPVLEVLQGRAAGRNGKAAAGKPGDNPGKTPVLEPESNLGKTPVLDPKSGNDLGSMPALDEKSQKTLVQELEDADRTVASTGTGGMSISALARFTGRHLCRFSLRSLLALLAVFGFLAASCWLFHAIQSGEQEAERLYLSTVVDAEITKKNSSVTISGRGGAYIGSRAVQEILDTGFVKDYTLIAGCDGMIDREDQEQSVYIEFTGIREVEKSLPKIGDGIQIRYGDGYGPNLFEEDSPGTGGSGQQTDAHVIFLSEQVAEELGAVPGEILQIENVDGSVEISAELGGVYTGWNIGVLAPMSVLEALGRGSLSYKTAEFSLDPGKNREMEEFRQRGKEIVEARDAGAIPLSLVIWDGELRRAVEPMEKNITLMKVLYPLANGVSFLAAFGLSILFLFQRRREAAILRILGVGTLVTRMVLVLELLAVDLAGILLSGVVSVILTGEGGFGAFLTAAGCYLAGCLAGTMAGAVLVTRGRPLELLQEKE